MFGNCSKGLEATLFEGVANVSAIVDGFLFACMTVFLEVKFLLLFYD